MASGGTRIRSPRMIRPPGNRHGSSRDRGTAMTQLAEVFAVKWHNFNLRRFAVFGVVLGLLIVVGVLPHDRR